jgi:26S proteasome non-ATPase regulatory subunit 9
MERELSSILDYLNAPDMPGLTGPLVDPEGFPRAELDLYRIREMRQRFNMLNNDHCAVMKEIELQMSAYYSGMPVEAAASGREEVKIEAVSVAPIVRSEPFAWVAEVTQGSPACTGGLLVNDKVVKITSITHEEFTTLSSLPDLVSHHVNQPLLFSILRTNEVNQDTPLEVSVTPQQWAGSGVLGCRLKPIGTS